MTSSLHSKVLAVALCGSVKRSGVQDDDRFAPPAHLFDG